MKDVIAESLGVAPIEHNVVEVMEHDIEDYETRLDQFKELALFNASQDIAEARKNLRSIASEGQELLTVVSAIIAGSEDPKAILAGSSFIKTITEVNMSIVKINTETMRMLGNSKRQPKEIKDEEKSIHIEQSNVVVSSADILANSAPKRAWEHDE